MLAAPTDVFFSERSVVEPDVVFVRGDDLDRVEDAFIRGAPDVVVEVSSPTTKALDLRRKLELYEHFGVPEYWYVDLDDDGIELFRLEGDLYGRRRVVYAGQTLTSDRLPGFSMTVDEALGYY